MKVKERLNALLFQLETSTQELDETQLQAFQQLALEAPHIFFAGAGRSGLMMRALAMRFMHLGKSAYVVGDVSTPAARPGDLLVMASGSGSTATLVTIATKAVQQLGCKLILITTQPDSPLGQLAYLTIAVHASNKVTNAASTTPQLQLGSSTFEEMTLLIGDALVANLAMQPELRCTNAQLMERHANLE